MAHAFSETALREQEPLLNTHINKLISQLILQIDSVTDGRVDLSKWYTLLAFDIVTDLSFGEPLGAVQGGQKHPFIENFALSCRLYPMIPMANTYAIMAFAFNLMMRIPSFKKSQEMGYLATKSKVERRMASKSPDRKDFMTYILRYNDERGMSATEIVGSTTVLVNAGGESVAACISAATFFMLRDSEILEKAQLEVRDSFTVQDQITLRTTAKLTYLNAVIEEALRIHPPTPGNFSRRTGSGGDIIDGQFIPPDTSVGIHQWSANHSPSNFYNPQKFAPERWLADPPEEYRNDNKAASQPWSIGPRNCLGRSLAYFEIRSTLAYMLWTFDMELCDESRDWATDQRFDVTWERPPLYVKLSRRS
ncbi:hypothetical protein MMC17_003309 [Xylographa soralifera]|nr:hypothetical protein [Xylographa soralifera]